MSSFYIKNRKIGLGQPVYIIAEMSANHCHEYEKAVTLIKEVKEAGADAIKLQTYTADTITIDCDELPFRLPDNLYGGITLYELYKKAFTPWEWQPKLKTIAEEIDLDLFSAPFDETAVDFLEEMNVDLYKVASSELVDTPLIRKIASTGKPIIMSTGMATLGEIENAIMAAQSGGCQHVCLLKCTASYPAEPNEMNLNSIPNLSKTFGVPVGLSDHTLGIEAPIAAVALGASVIEKHVTLSRNDGGPDAEFSLEIHEFKQMVEAVRKTELMLGEVRYGPVGKEKISRKFRRSLFVTKDIKAGELLTKENIRSIRPGNGLPPLELENVLGKTAQSDIKRGTPLSWKHIN